MKKHLYTALFAVLIFCSHFVNAQVNVTKNLVAYWSFDDSTYTDNSGHGHNGKAKKAPANTPGVSGNALRFNGTSSWVTVPNAPGLNFGKKKSFSISLWYRADTPTLNIVGAPFVSKFGGGSPSTDYAIFADISSSKEVRWGTGDASDTIAWMSYHHYPAVHKWHHIVTTIKDSVSGGTDYYPKKFYIDGKLVRWGIATKRADSVTNNLDLGSWYSNYDGKQHYFDGALDEIRIYDSVLDTAQVRALYTFSYINNIGVVSKAPGIHICEGKQLIKVKVKNYGGGIITSFKLQGSINGISLSSYSWAGKLSAHAVVDITIDSFYFTARNTYKLKVYTSLPNGQADATPSNDTDNYFIKADSMPSIKVGVNKGICAGSSDTLGYPARTGFVYSWSSSPVGFTSSSAMPVVSPSASTTFTLTQTDTVDGCTNQDTVRITVNPLPVLNAGRPQTICSGQSASIGSSSSAGHSYTWNSSPAGFTSSGSNPTVSPVSTTSYHLLETILSTGCYAMDSVKITVNPLPIVKTGGSHIGCLGHSFTLGDSAMPGIKYSWTSKPVGFISSYSNPHVAATATTVYYLKEVNTITNCSNMDSATITVYPSPDAKFSFNSSGKTFHFIPEDSTIGSYTWDFGDSTGSPLVKPTHTFTHSGSFKISLTTENSYHCTSTYDTLYLTTGIDEYTPSEELFIKLYPNPASNQLNLSVNLPANMTFEYKLYDVLGREVKSGAPINLTHGDHNCTIISSNDKIRPGIYYLKMTIGSNVSTYKVILK